MSAPASRTRFRPPTATREVRDAGLGGECLKLVLVEGTVFSLMLGEPGVDQASAKPPGMNSVDRPRQG
jgi:hypothetical protein